MYKLGRKLLILVTLSLVLAASPTRKANADFEELDGGCSRAQARASAAFAVAAVTCVVGSSAQCASAIQDYVTAANNM